MKKKNEDNMAHKTLILIDYDELVSILESQIIAIKDPSYLIVK